MDKFNIHHKCGSFNPDAPCMKQRRFRPQNDAPLALPQTDPIDENDNLIAQGFDDDDYDLAIDEYLQRNVHHLPDPEPMDVEEGNENGEDDEQGPAQDVNR